MRPLVLLTVCLLGLTFLTGSPGPVPEVLAAPGDTTWFGGTVWAADSARWEAVEGGFWTFDTGVGSHFVHSKPDVYPFKDPSLHALMEGWIGINRTQTEHEWFRRMSETDFTNDGASPCVGDAAGLGGDYSYWCGLLPSEAAALCYASGMGYGDNWRTCIQKEFTYSGFGTVNLRYDYVCGTETGFDYVYVYSDPGSDSDTGVELDKYDGPSNDSPNLTLSSFSGELPLFGGSYTIKFCVVSDHGYSDEDGAWPTDCGAFAVDNIILNGGGISDTSSFETGNDGWSLAPEIPGKGGDWSNVVLLDDLLPPPCLPGAGFPCGLTDSVLVFDESLNPEGYSFYTENIVASPWIDLRRAGLVGQEEKTIEYNAYSCVSAADHLVFLHEVQWYPYTCPVNGRVMTSPWVPATGLPYFQPPGVQCNGELNPLRISIGDQIPADAEQIRIGIGVWNLCRFDPNCLLTRNPAPWFDNIRFGISASTVGVPGDGTPVVSRPILAAHPNPFMGSIRLEFAVPEDTRAEVRIFDLHGRMVRAYHPAETQAVLTWDGRDTSGRPAAAGVYFIQVSDGVQDLSKRVVLLR